MTIEEFDKTRWCYGMRVKIISGIHEGKIYYVYSLNFDQKLIGICDPSSLPEDCDDESSDQEVEWFRCESCILISETETYILKKNTIEIQNVLESIGYRKSSLFDPYSPWIIVNPKTCQGEVLKGEYCDFCEAEIDLDESIVDYGTNCEKDEDLFFSLISKIN